MFNLLGTKNWQQLSVTSHNQRYLQERNDSSFDHYHFPPVWNYNFKCILCGLPRCASLHILSLLNIKTCSFQFPLRLYACKENKSAFFSISRWKMLFVYTASKSLVSVQIPMKKIEMTVLGEKTNKKQNSINMPDSISILVEAQFVASWLVCPSKPWDVFLSRLYKQIHTQNTISPRMTSSCFSVPSRYCFFPALKKMKTDANEAEFLEYMCCFCLLKGFLFLVVLLGL